MKASERAKFVDKESETNISGFLTYYNIYLYYYINLHTKKYGNARLPDLGLSKFLFSA